MVVEISLGDITEETTDVIVNSVRGDLDLTTGKIISKFCNGIIDSFIRNIHNISAQEN